MRRLDKFDDLVCGTDATIGDVLRRINKTSPNLFQIVVSAEKRVLGTVTDGDVRRAMLDGVTMSDMVEKCMRPTPILGRTGEELTNRVLLRRAWFLPVVNATGQLDHVLVQPRRESLLSRALVMAGGFGKRLGELTREVPKPLLPVGGRPILDRVIEQLEAAGVSLIYVSVHYKAEQIREFVRQRRNLAEISFIEESEPMGTAGALTQLSNETDEPILVVNGDVITQADVGAMCDFNLRHGYDATIAVSRYEVQVPFGVIRQTSEGAFARIDEKPSVSHFVAAGLYYLSPEFIALTPRGRVVDMPELLTLGVNAGLRIGLFPVHEYWKDVGKPSDLLAAHNDHEKT